VEECAPLQRATAPPPLSRATVAALAATGVDAKALFAHQSRGVGPDRQPRTLNPLNPSRQ